MTNKFRFISAALFTSMIFMAPPAALASMRCGTHIITEGGDFAPGQHEVLKRCGEPTSRSGNVWVYKKSSSVSRALYFDDNGRLYRID